ncbi:sugar ABC transporter permease [Nocardioides baekrokdamisoli]|uniref:Sugar ABC transporter permease n=1 Tax=Nocardioides baekrokdamisoli TaxID=1804624 RepID=A0A3G9IUX4_9ACTN|nr:ABC transporter permease [Nocardioides baekrokdamisoli]BBH17461.1 sugar ABC transporter permease [Nocardioides baekrokdamisoli]
MLTDAAQPPTTAATRAASALRRLVEWESFGLLVVVAAVFFWLTAYAPYFLTQSNLLNVLQQAAFFGIIALAMTLVIVAGEIDISVGSQTALTSALLGVLIGNHGWPLWLACLAVMAEAMALGAVAGWIRSKFEVPTFIITLALYMALRGAAQLITNNYSIPINGHFFYWGTGHVFGKIPIAAVYFVVAFIVFGFLARYTVLGRSVYAVGGNARSAEMSGIRVRRIRVLVLVMCGFTAALTGMLQTAQLSSGTPTIGVGLEFSAISAAIIGGCSLAGGKGTITGTFMGVIFVAMLNDGMVLRGINPNAQPVVLGVVVLVAVLINVVRANRVAKRS